MTDELNHLKKQLTAEWSAELGNLMIAGIKGQRSREQFEADSRRRAELWELLRTVGPTAPNPRTLDEIIDELPDPGWTSDEL